MHRLHCRDDGTGAAAIVVAFVHRVAIDVLTSFLRLAVSLQTISHVAKKVADNRRTDFVPLLR
jgi:hypothetical protein